MGLILDDMKMVEQLSLSVYNNKQATSEIRLEEEAQIEKLCSAVFPKDGTSPSQHDLNKFNNIVAKTATVISERDVQQLLKYLAEVQSVAYNLDMVKYTKDVPKHVRFKWAAVGSGVSLREVETGKPQYLEITQIQTGLTYNSLAMSDNQVEAYRQLVRDVAAARIELIYTHIMKLIQAAVANGGVIPEKQIKNGSNVTIAEFDKVANVVGRRTSSRPLFIADRALISDLAGKKAAIVTTGMPDALKSDFYNYEVTNLGSADAIVLQNDFTTEKGYETQFPITTGYLVAGAAGNKPFQVALAGGLTQKTEEEAEFGRIKMIVRQRIGIDFLYAENIGVVVDTNVTI